MRAKREHKGATGGQSKNDEKRFLQCRSAPQSRQEAYRERGAVREKITVFFIPRWQGAGGGQRLGI